MNNSLSTADECKKKWKNLRIQQRRIIINKIKKTDKKSTVQWNCYDALKFLIPHMDWTPADDVKKDADFDMSVSMLSDAAGDDDTEDDYDECENDENCETQSEDSYTSSSFQQSVASESSAAAQADSTDITQMTNTPNNDMPYAETVPESANKLNQCVLAYLPQSNTIHFRNDGDAATFMTTSTPNCMPIASQAINTSSMFATNDGTSHTMDNKMQANRLITVPVTPPSTVNYFLMDVAMQMDRLNDIAQMELKIEIHRLLLEKLRNPSNLRQAPSICFTTTQNPN